jgi:hypothetical protein
MSCVDAGKKGHFKLNSNDVKQWDMAIVAGKATVQFPPLDLRPQPANNSRKRRQSDSSDSEDEPESRRGRRSIPNISVNICQDSQSSDSEDEPESRRGRRSSTRNISVNIYQDSQCSKCGCGSSSPTSPFLIKTISLSEYIAWHVDKLPELGAAYVRALEILQSEDVKVHQLSMVPSAQWKNWGIPWGIYTCLKTDIGSYMADKRLGNV